MCETAEQIVPKRLIRLDGFKWKASPNNPVVIFTLPLVAALNSESADRGRSIIQVSLLLTF
jgi:hypothetical protein